MQFFKMSKLFIYRYERMGKIHLVKKQSINKRERGRKKIYIYIFGYLSNITCPWEWEISGWEQV